MYRNTLRVGFTLSVVLSSLHGVTLPLLVTCSIIGESLEYESSLLLSQVSARVSLFTVLFIQQVQSPPRLQTYYLQVIDLPCYHY